MKSDRPPDDLDRLGSDVARGLRTLARLRGLQRRATEDSDLTKLIVLREAKKIAQQEFDSALADRLEHAAGLTTELVHLGDAHWLADRKDAARSLWQAADIARGAIATALGHDDRARAS